MSAILFMSFSILMLLFAARLRRQGQSGKSRALLVLAVLMAAFAVLAALSFQVRNGALAPVSPTADTTR